MADRLFAKGRYAEAAEEYARFVLSHPGDLLGRFQLAIQLYRARRFDEAEGHFRRTRSTSIFRS